MPDVGRVTAPRPSTSQPSRCMLGTCSLRIILAEKNKQMMINCIVREQSLSRIIFLHLAAALHTHAVTHTHTHLPNLPQVGVQRKKKCLSTPGQETLYLWPRARRQFANNVFRTMFPGVDRPARSVAYIRTCYVVLYLLIPALDK